MTLSSQCKTRIKTLKKELDLGEKFHIKDLGLFRYFLGISVEQVEEGVWIGQPNYTRELLRRYGMEECKPVGTPMNTSQQLTQAKDGEESVDRTRYQSLIGSVMYLSVCTRPDITYSVSNLAKFSQHPTEEHWTGAKRLLRYLKRTANLRILYTRKKAGELRGYTDADWGGDQDSRRSTSGYVFLRAGGAVSWKSRKQQTVALSTAEAEYVAASAAAQEAIWLRKLLTDLGHPSWKKIISQL